MNVDGSGQIELILPSTNNAHEISQSWSSDGKYHAYYVQGPEQGIWILPIEDNGRPGRPVRFTSLDERNATIRPLDGRCIAYTSKETGQSEVYLAEVRWDNLSKGWVEKISTHGGTEPCWARDGSRLYYRGPDGMMEVAVNCRADGSIEIGENLRLFDDQVYGKETGGQQTDYDVTSDGRFLMVRNAPLSRINIILHWSAELKRLAPPGKG